jgi:hypothetical protein
MPKSDYYKGAYKVQVGGYPIRMAFKPSPVHKLWLGYRHRAPGPRRFTKRGLGKQLEIYADTLGISLREARARIAAQQEILAVYELEN